MADFDNRLVRGATTVADTMDAGLRAHMLRVYNYMVGALALTGVVAYVVANTPALLNALYQEVQTANGVALSPTILGWVVAHSILEVPFTFDAQAVIVTVAGGGAATLLFGLVGALGALSARPARRLRSA